MTNSDCPGVEKLVCTGMKQSWTTTPMPDLNGLHLSDNDLPPCSLFAVKGWNRSVCCMALLMAAYEHPVLYEAPHWQIVILWTLYAMKFTSHHPDRNSKYGLLAGNAGRRQAVPGQMAGLFEPFYVRWSFPNIFMQTIFNQGASPLSTPHLWYQTRPKWFQPTEVQLQFVMWMFIS